ncbi:ATP-binding protein [Streptomyces sp. DT24]|uniref:ATP-binding protein n=1 Tax=Streptomyces sp. DT24 TaxID=3416520 RepID=UPI003CFB7D3C
MRVCWPRRVSGQVLMVQLAITTGVMVLATGLFLAPLASELDDEAMLRALAIAQTTAADPDIPRELAATEPSVNGPVQSEAEEIRRSTRALYVVVMDTRGVRWSHTTASEIGRRVSTDPSAALAGHEIREIDNGTLGRSARAKVPLYDDDGRIIGAVSAGIPYASVRERLIDAVPGLLLCAGVALSVGALVAVAVSRRLRRRTHGIAFTDISALLDEREAMLHGVREGVVACDGNGRVRLVNDEAGRLLGLGADAPGRTLTEILPPGRTREVLAGHVAGADLLTVSGGRVLVVNRMPTGDGGAVVTLRDRTELELLGRELDSTQGLLDALRAQDHEHANRLHTVLGLLELGRYGTAVEYVAEVADIHRAAGERIAERVHDPLLSALLVGKAAVAAERGVALRVSSSTLLPDRVVDPRDPVTVLGNLIDNALDAVADRLGTDPSVEVELRAEHTTMVLRVSDTGPGVPPERRERIFTEGWSTKGPGRPTAPPPAYATLPSADAAPGWVPPAGPALSRLSPLSDPPGLSDPPAGAAPLSVPPTGPALLPGPPAGPVLLPVPPAFQRGRGLGLALVRRLAERYGGSARVTARAGGGAVFTVVLPEALGPPPADVPTGAERLTAAGDPR